MATLSTNLNLGRQKKEDHERDKGEILDSAENTNAVRNNILLNVLWNNIYDVYFHCGVSKSGLVQLKTILISHYKSFYCLTADKFPRVNKYLWVYLLLRQKITFANKTIVIKNNASQLSFHRDTYNLEENRDLSSQTNLKHQTISYQNFLKND